MRIATLQFSPRVGDVAANFQKADALIKRQETRGELKDIDVLVLPELAFTGYNHPSLSAITPFLEPTASGPSTSWASGTAKRLRCTVAVGYPEVATGSNHNAAADATIPPSSDIVAYNSLVFVNHEGIVVAHYRKSFLYYTDDTWAKEGDGFYQGDLTFGDGSLQMKTVAGICMDINPYKFQSAWTEYEFANHSREMKAQIVILSMAWLTRLNHEDMQGDLSETPDQDTVGYWIERFRPLLGPNGPQDEVIVVFANRAGEEGEAPIIGEVRYAGSSSVMGMRGDLNGGTNVRIWDIMGRAQDGVLVVDTSDQPFYTVAREAPEIPAGSEAGTADQPALATTIGSSSG